MPAGSKLVVEVYLPNLLSDNSVFYLGANSEPETGQSYIRSLLCGINERTPTNDQGMLAHDILNVVGRRGRPAMSICRGPASIR